ncbi:B12-binding domain-containing radical SAM protein [Winogradskyella litoriviva]|uniref:B12-binding domain-containing radical SAM protein n=1 Tax=Winogradskyella litoriviva TaxID=1220182 RepID=A0ABX2E781_9FLAO|nr:radical SAM protein [Winogradskyella litoriviva]NRD24318.1 B12-binding domain-containing radical SAM protein [Winogradskyella litoriviva]
MLNVVFSHSYYYKFDPKQWNNKTPFPPLGTLYAASYLRENGYNVGVFDANLLDDPKTIEPYLKKQSPNYFVLYDDGFNYLTKMCLTTMREASFEMIKIAKKQNCKVVVCSSDSTDHYEKYLNAGADFVIQGEGEITLKELLDALENDNDTSSIKGLIFRTEDDIIKNPKRPVVRDLDELPLPAWDLIDIDSYKTIWKSGGNEFTLNIATTRGCPFKCNWCAKPIYGNRYNSHSPEYITKHIKYLSETYGVNRFWMCDDIFGLKPNWVQNFNTSLKKEQLSISYYIQSRVDLLLKEDTIDALAESGLEEVWVGAESGSQTVLDAMDKDTTVEQIYKATRLLKEKNIRVAFFIQFGYLGETKDDIAKTISMIKELVPDNIGVSVSYPLPGTKFYDKVKDDLKLKANWTDSDDLAMMFKGTFNTEYYRKLQRYVHKEFRKSQAFQNLRKGIKNPFKLSKHQLRSIVLLGYYLPSAFLDKLQLKNMELSNG